MTKSDDVRQDLIGGLGPDERCRPGVVRPQVLLDGGLEFPRAPMDPTPELLLGEGGEPTLHLVEPRRPDRGEVQVVARVTQEPAVDQGRLVGPVVVQNPVDVERWRDRGLDGVQEPPELSRSVSGVALPENAPGLDVERREERGRAVPGVVVHPPLDLSQPEGQHGLGAVQGLDLALLIHAEDESLVRRVQVQAQMSRTFSMNSGSGESLKVSVRWGVTPQARAMVRVLQWVAPRGVVSRVRVITRATAASLIRRGAPGRGSSRSPSRRFARNRARHFPTVCWVSPRRWATVAFAYPAAHMSTSRARWARAWAVFGRAAQRCKVLWSSVVSVSGGNGRPRRIGVLLSLRRTPESTE